MVYAKGIVSCKRWRPILNVRTRSPLVQTTAFEFLKQLKILRSGVTALPNINSISLPSHRQFVVTFGDMDSLCDCMEFIFNNCGVFSAAYGGPDDRGTVWIEFYKNRTQRPFQGTRPNDSQELPEGYSPREEPQFVIWIKSLGSPSIAFDDVKTVKQRTANPTRALEASRRVYHPLRLTQSTQPNAPRQLVNKRTAGENRKRGGKRK